VPGQARGFGTPDSRGERRTVQKTLQADGIRLEAEALPRSTHGWSIWLRMRDRRAGGLNKPGRTVSVRTPLLFAGQEVRWDEGKKLGKLAKPLAERVQCLLHHATALGGAPPAFHNRPSRGLRPRAPLRRYPPPSCAACPGHAGPLSALLRGRSRGCYRAALGAREEVWGGVTAGGERWGALPRGRRQKAVCCS
jgi:hypothetical protein